MSDGAPAPWFCRGKFNTTHNASETEGCEFLFAWWTGMMAVTAVNIGLTILALRYIKAPKDHAGYSTAMKALGVPFVWNCAWRTVFPSLYLQRFVFWDTWLSAILVDRIWACIGELAWTCQIALALWMIDSRITNSSGGTGRTWVRVSAVTAVGLYVMAEAVSFYNTATTNEWYAAAEVILDGVSWLQMAPAIAVLFSKAPGTVCMSTGKFFLAVMAVLCLVYPLYNFVVDAPMYYARYRADQARNKTYFEFIDGLVDAATRRIVTHEIRAWDEDLSWMTIYFSAAAWSAILLMFAPLPLPSTGNADTTTPKPIALKRTAASC